MALTRPTVAQLNTIVTEISDPILVLNKGSTQANVDVGFVFNRDGGINPNVALYWNETTDSLVTAYTGSTGGLNANIAIMSYANLTVGNLTVYGNLVPSANITYDLGSPTQRWRTGYFSANTIDLGGSTIGVSNNAFVFTSDGVTQSLSANGVSTANTFSAATTTIKGNLIVNATTGAASTTTGALRVMGGVGVSGSTYTKYLTVEGEDGVDSAELKANLVLNTYGSAIKITPAYPRDAQLIIGSVTHTTNPSITLGNPLSTGGRPNSSTINFNTGLGGTPAYIQYTNSSQDWDFTHASLDGSINFRTYSSVDDGLKLTVGGTQGNVKIYSNAQSTSATTGALVINGGLGVGKNSYFNGNVVIQGNLFVNGNTTTINANNLSINDSMIYLADDNPADTLDIGIVSAFTNPGYQHTGFVRDATDGIWKLFANVVTEPTTTVDFTNATYSTLKIGSLQTETVISSGNISAASFTYANNVSILNAVYSDLSTLYANAATQSDLIIQVAGNIVTANIGIIGYIDAQDLAGNIYASSLVTTANIGMGGYVDAQDLAGNIYASSLVTTANIGIIGYIDQANTIQADAITQANVGMKGYVDLSNSSMKSYVDSSIVAAGGYSNVQVATYLPTYTGVVTSSNVFVTGNITAQYIIGNGSQLTGLPAGYSNVQVATYLPTYTGVVTASNVAVNGNVTVDENLFVGGALYIAGNSTTISTNNVVFNDALIYLANGNPTDFLDIGFIGNFTRSALYSHTGFARDATDGVWKLFEGVEPEPTTTIDFGSASYATALIGNLVTRSNVTVGGNTRLSGALLNSAGLGGNPGQLLQSTGTGITWVDLDFSTLSDGANTTVTAESANVNVTVNTTAVASFGETSLVVEGDVHATQFIGNGSQLTGLPAGYSNVDAATFLASGTLNTSINTTGNIIAANINAGGVRQTTSSSAPSIATVGDQWYDSGTDIVFQYTYDGTNFVWVDIGSVALNTNIATIQGTTLNITGNGTIGTTFTSGAHTITGNPVTALINGGTTGVGNIGASGAAFNTVFARATSAQYADLAEKYTSDYDYTPGTVLVFGGTQEVTVSTSSHDPRVAGVVTTDPAYLMNDTLDGVAVALTGRVPCRVLGPVNKGDRLVTSQHSGVAQRLNNDLYQPGCIIGKSLEKIESAEISTIEIAIGRF